MWKKCLAHGNEAGECRCGSGSPEGAVGPLSHKSQAWCKQSIFNFNYLPEPAGQRHLFFLSVWIKNLELND